MGARVISARAFKGAVSFLTRIPTGTGISSPESMATWVPYFPVVGALVGLSGAVAYAAATVVWVPIVAASIAVAVEVVVTGGFHEDGLGDGADALGASDPEQARRILKDPRLGSFGVLAISLGIILRVGALATLQAWSAVAVLPAAHALARAAATSILGSAPIAGEGLGAAYARALSRRTLVAGATAALLIAVVAIGLWAPVAAAACAVVAMLLQRAATRRLGGVTGDVLGAIQQCGLVAVLLLASAVETQGWPPLAWWR
jgi:adenosylcobinamide-GDP ribazoletransferase